MKTVNGWFVQDNDTYVQKMCDDGFPIDGFLHDELIDILGLSNYRNALDIGSHIGIWSNVLNKRFNCVYAFEPSKTNCECYRKNLAYTNNVILHNYAVSNTNDEKITICQLMDKNYGSYCMTKTKFHQEYDVITKSIDSFNFKDIDFIQLHTKGSEYQILQGSKETIEKYKPTIVFQIYGDQLSFFSFKEEDVFLFFEDLNYGVISTNLFKKWDISFRIAYPK